MNEAERFMKWEKWLFRFYWITVTVSLTLVIIIYNVGEDIRTFVNAIGALLVFLLFAPLVSFILSIIRIIKYFIKRAEWEDAVRIWRSVVIFFTSPIATAVYYVLFIVAMLSLASCTYSG